MVTGGNFPGLRQTFRIISCYHMVYYVLLETSSFCTDPLTGLTGVAMPIADVDGFTNGDLGTIANHCQLTVVVFLCVFYVVFPFLLFALSGLCGTTNIWFLLRIVVLVSLCVHIILF